MKRMLIVGLTSGMIGAIMGRAHAWMGVSLDLAVIITVAGAFAMVHLTRDMID